MPRPLSAVPSAEKGDPWVAPTNISLRRGEACLAPFQHAGGGTHGSPLRISLLVGARHASPCFSMPAAEKGDPWVAPTNISLRRGAACLALFQHAVGGEGRPMGRPYEISLADLRNVQRPPTGISCGEQCGK